MKYYTGMAFLYCILYIYVLYCPKAYKSSFCNYSLERRIPPSHVNNIIRRLNVYARTLFRDICDDQSITMNCSSQCEGNIGEAVEHEETLCDEMETVSECTYLGDRVSAGGGCEAVVTERTRHGWVKSRECGELLYGRMFPLRLKGAVYKSYIRPAILYGSEAWCLKKVRWEFYEGQKDPW